MENSADAVKAGPFETGVHELLLRRWSPRAFSDEPVSKEDLRKIFTAASWAASSYNEQPWRFLVGFKGDKTHRQIFDSLMDFNKSWAHTAPILILSIAVTTMSKDGNENDHALHDTGAASANMCLQATALGLYAHGMAGFDKTAAADAFQLPTNCVPVAVWALGHLGDRSALPAFLQPMETVPRDRKPLAQFVFAAWESPTDLAS